MHYQKGQKVWFLALSLNTPGNSNPKPVVAPWENHFSNILMAELNCTGTADHTDVPAFLDPHGKVWSLCNHVTGLETRVVEPVELRGSLDHAMQNSEEFLQGLCKHENLRMMDLSDFLELLLRIAANNDIEEADRRIANEQYGEIVMMAQKEYGLSILRRTPTTVDIRRSEFT